MIAAGHTSHYCVCCEFKVVFVVAAAAAGVVVVGGGGGDGFVAGDGDGGGVCLLLVVQFLWAFVCCVCSLFVVPYHLMFVTDGCNYSLSMVVSHPLFIDCLIGWLLLVVYYQVACCILHVVCQ